MSPLAKPRTNAPRTPNPPACASRFCNAEGRVRSNKPNMLNAIMANKTASAPTTQGLARALPKALPVRAETTPSGVKSAAIPRTNALESIAALARLSACLAPNTLTVIAIIGYTHGVSEVARPAKKTSPKAPR